MNKIASLMAVALAIFSFSVNSRAHGPGSARTNEGGRRSDHSRSGGFVGNGAAEGRGHAEGAAWFLGNSPILACASDPGLLPAFESALGKWRRYMEEKQITKQRAGLPPIAMNARILSECDGSEELLLEILPDAAGAELSAAEIFSYDENLGRGQGRIWLNAKVLRNPATLESQLLHQLGHVFGCDHVRGTIMDEAVPKEELNPDPHIDGARELFLCAECGASWQDNQGNSYRENGEKIYFASRGSNAGFQVIGELSRTNASDGKIFRTYFQAKENFLESKGWIRLARNLGAPVKTWILSRNFEKLSQIRSTDGKELLEFPAKDAP